MMVRIKGKRGTLKNLAKILLSLIMCFICSRTAFGQVLSFDDAVKELLEKNFDIRIVENNKTIASSFNSSANAGFLPTVDGSVNYQKAITNTEQEFLDGRTDNQSNAERNDLSASLILNWTLFDGFDMFAEKGLLESNERLSEFYLRAASEEAILMLATLYYQLVSQQKSIELSRQSLQISRERYSLAVKRESIGNGSKLEVSQSLIDLSSDSSMLLTNLNLEANLKAELNQLLNRELMAGITVDNEIPIDLDIDYDQIMNAMATTNSSLLIARENTRVVSQQLRQSKSTFYPEAGVFAGYNYGKSTSEVGFLRSNQNFGPTIGFFINFNLFNGLKDYKNVQAKIVQQENADLAREKADQANQLLVLKAYRNYKLGLNLLKLENENSGRAEENLSIALKKFELGNINSIEFREIQLQFLQSQSRLLNAQYMVRIHALELEKLAGTLALQP